MKVKRIKPDYSGQRNIILSDLYLKKIPHQIKDIYCDIINLNNNHITSLENLPYASTALLINNQIQNLDNLTEEHKSILTNINVSYNQITTFEYEKWMSKTLFNIVENPLQKVIFNSDNAKMRGLRIVNSIQDLQGFPKEKFTGYLILGGLNLKSMKGAPKIIEGDLDIMDSNLESLEHFPKMITNDLEFLQTTGAKYFSEQDIRKVCNVRGDIKVYWNG